MGRRAGGSCERRSRESALSARSRALCAPHHGKLGRDLFREGRVPEIPVALIAIRVRKIAEDDGARVDAVHAAPVARGRRDGGANGARVADFARRLDIAVNLEVCEHEQPHGHVGADARVRREAVDAAPAGRGAADAHEDAPRRRDPRERHAVKNAADVAGQRAEDALAAGRRRVARERRVGRFDARTAGHARLVVGPLRPQLRHVCREARVGRRPGHDGLRGPVAPVDPDLRGRGLGESEQRGRRRRRGCERQRRTAAGRHPTRASRLRTLRPSRRGPGRAFRSRRRRPGTRDCASPISAGSESEVRNQNLKCVLRGRLRHRT